MFSKKALLSLFLLVSLLLPSYAALGSEKLKVFVTIPPQKYFVERIGKERVQVQTLIPAGSDVHTYEPRPNQMKALQQSKLYFSIGDLSAFEESQLPKIAKLNPNLKIIDTSLGIKRLETTEPLMIIGKTEEHEDDHGHGDPHIWTSPKLAVLQIDAILKGLTQADPEGKAFYKKNRDALVGEIKELDKELRERFKPHKGSAFLVFHPAWGYLAKEYGLRQVAIEMDGKEPKPMELAKVMQLAKKEKIKFIFVSPQRSSASAETIAKEIGGTVVIADPLAENWLENLRSVGKSIAKALR